MIPFCPHCSKPMKQLLYSFYCDCKKEVKESNNNRFKTSQEAFLYAWKHGSDDESRKIACEDSYCAYYYAYEVDRTSRDDTREASCKSSVYA